MSNTKADEVVYDIVCMGIGANSHATPAVRADSGPVGVAAFGIQLPAQGAVFMGLAVPIGDCLGRTDNSAFIAVAAKVDHRWMPGWRIVDQG